MHYIYHEYTMYIKLVLIVYKNCGTGSSLFEVNLWMWHYGRAFPRKISVVPYAFTISYATCSSIAAYTK